MMLSAIKRNWSARASSFSRKFFPPISALVFAKQNIGNTETIAAAGKNNSKCFLETCLKCYLQCCCDADTLLLSLATMPVGDQ